MTNNPQMDVVRVRRLTFKFWAPDIPQKQTALYGFSSLVFKLSVASTGLSQKSVFKIMQPISVK